MLTRHVYVTSALTSIFNAEYKLTTVLLHPCSCDSNEQYQMILKYFYTRIVTIVFSKTASECDVTMGLSEELRGKSVRSWCDGISDRSPWCTH